MLSLTDSRRLLETARDHEGLLQCAREVGFTESTSVGLHIQRKLGIEGAADRFDVAEGRGALRALLVTFSKNVTPRDALGTIAARLTSSVPHLLWIVFSTDRASHVGISAWIAGGSRVRLHTLLADPKRITESDAQTLCALASISATSDILTHIRWTEVLGREAITIRFFRALQGVINELANSLQSSIPGQEASDLALLYVSRLLFLSFVESKGWLNRDFDFLSNTFIQCMTSGGNYHRRVLVPLFFGTLNTPTARRARHAKDFGRIPFLNGGLFGRTHAERLHRFEFPDDALGEVFGKLLTRFRFTNREQSAGVAESAIDPEILGRAFESLMQSEIRRSSGAFYTPHSIVERVCSPSLANILEGAGVSQACIGQLLAGLPVSAKDRPSVLGQIGNVKLIDPACGSGAFLVYMLEKLASIRALAGDQRATGERRREVLANSIFGVDINPTAVWLCELRLWLSVVVETQVDDPAKVLPLPNLDRNIRVGDSLGAAPSGRFCGAPRAREIERTRMRYVRASGTSKKLIARMLDRLERQHAIALLRNGLTITAAERRDLLLAIRSRDLFGLRQANTHHVDMLASLRVRKREAEKQIIEIQKGGALPFSFETHFPEAMEAGGFDLVVGNPPWVRLHHISSSSKESFRRNFLLFRTSGWRTGAERAHAGVGFSSQIDLSALFVERSICIARPGATISLLLPSKLWKSLAGGGVRALVAQTCEIHTLEDFSDSKSQFDAATYPSLLIAKTRSVTERNSSPAAQISAVVHRRREVLQWSMSPDMLPLDQSVGAPWLLLPPAVRAAFDSLLSHGIPLAESRFGRPILGVKTGCNDAFVVEFLESEGDRSKIRRADTIAEIESRSLRRVVKGDAIEQWRIKASGERIIWTHGECGEPLKTLPPLTLQLLQAWRRELARRTDAHNASQWWRVFRTEAANCTQARVVWSDIGRFPRAAVIPAGDESVPLNTCYVVQCSSHGEAAALAALLNSPLVSAWLSVLAEPAQGGYKRYLGWTMASLPIPRNWDRVKLRLARLHSRAESGDTPSRNELFEATLRAYDLDSEQIQPLMLWAEQ